MSIFPRKFHGPELKCGGPSMCRDCQERIKQAQELGIDNPFSEWQTQPKEDKIEEILKIIKNKPKSE